uniref:Tyrosine-protein kinase ephrin type A/B receptor-like domain-containing protein n=1 Tax=Cryptomonas curvata TaxID=233186 RepID=A0A7S0QR61_9CRYP
MDATINCIICPAGHSCMLDATTDPSSCPAGTYRSALDSVSCILCPTGTWSIRTGLTDMSLCEPCPPGVVCSIGGTTNLSLSSPCPEGYVCDTGTNSERQFKVKCPAGYFCDFGTTPTSQYDFPCDPGFGCPEGTAFSTRVSLPCSPGYYCLAGSMSQRPLQTKCPIGTTSLEGALSVYECFRSGTESICRVSPYYNTSFDPCLLKLKCWKTSPEDQEKQSTCFYKGIAEARYDFEGGLKNLVVRENNFLKLEAMANAVVKLDFRNVPIRMEHASHYEIVIYFFNKTDGIRVHRVYAQCLYLKSKEGTYEDLSCQDFSGTWFESNTVDKHGILEFTISTHYEIWFRVEVEIVHGLYIENKNYTAFRQTMSITFHYPTRANYLPQYDQQNLTSSAVGNRALQARGDCVVERNGIFRPCSRLFYVTLNSADLDLNVALNVEEPFQPDVANDNNWKFMTMPMIDFTTTNITVPLVVRPFVTNKADGILGVGKKNSEAYPSSWSNRGPNTDNVGTGDDQMIVLPYLPFFSKCRGFDSHIPLFRVLEDERRDNIEGGCNLTSKGQGRSINQWDPLNSPSQDELDLENIADACHWIIHCSYEEQIDKTPLPQRWFSRDPGSILFSLTRDAFNENDYRNLNTFKSFLNTDLLVPAYVSSPDIPYDPKLVVSGVPRKVTLILSYYQRDINTKRIVDASVSLDDYEIPDNVTAPGARDYTLEINFKAISWSSLLNLFALDLEVYAVFYMLLGLSVVVFGAVFWAFNRLFTRLSSPPAFRFLSYAGLTTLPPIQGFLIALIPILAIVLFLEILFNQINLLSLPNETFGNIADNLYGSGDVTQMKRTADGRFAVALAVISFYAMFITAKLLTPQKDRIIVQEASRTTESEIFTDPNIWHRTHIVFSYCVTVVVYSAIFEYSYSNMMRNYFYTNLMLIYIFNIFYEAFLEELLGDDLMVKSHSVIADLAVGIMTMAASSFLDFVQGYIIAMLLETAQRVYVDPGIDWLLERWEFLLRLYEKYKARREMLRDEEGADADDLEDDDLWLDVEDEQPASPVEHILGSYAAYSCGAIVMLYAPFVVLFVDWAEQHSGVGAAFGIRKSDFKFYWLFNFFSILPTMMRDVFVHNISELFHGWKVYEYMKYCRHRYSKRQFRWKASDPHEDETLKASLRLTDLLCFSSQYYFILAFSACGAMFLILALQILLRQTDNVKDYNPYNPFGDKMLPFVILIVFAFCKLLHYACIHFGYRFLWRHKRVAADIGDEGLLLGEGDKNSLNLPDWGQQGFGAGSGGGGGGNNIDITTDSFRHRFFEANKPWIIQQLRKTMSPRAQLEALTKGELLPDDTDRKKGGDVSDDDGSDSDSARDDKFELDPLAKVVAQRWLSKTRHRLGLPDRKQAALDISSDDESSDEDDDAPTRKPKLSSASRDIAQQWLASVRKNNVPGKEAADSNRLDISSDEGSESADDDRPVVAMSGQSRQIAKKWLDTIRNNAPVRPRAQGRSDDISDEDSSEDGFDNSMQVGPKAKAIAKIWLQQGRRQLGNHGAPSERPDLDVSDDESSSDSEAPNNSESRNIPLTGKTKAIALAWLRNIRIS